MNYFEQNELKKIYSKTKDITVFLFIFSHHQFINKFLVNHFLNVKKIMFIFVKKYNKR